MMKRLNYLFLAGIVIFSGLLGWVITKTMLVNGYNPVVLTPLLSILFLAVAIYLLYQGRQVLKLKRHQHTQMTSVGAFRVVVMAHSGAYTGSLFLGLLTSQIYLGTTQWAIPILRINAIYAALNALGALVLLVIAVIVERWCVIDDEEEEGHQKTSSESPIRSPRRATSRTGSSLS